MFRKRRPYQVGPPVRAFFEQEIARAHLLFDSGQFAEAAGLFERLAEIATTRNGPRAPRFYIQAGRSLLHAHQTDRGMQLLEQGRQLALQTGKAAMIQRIAPVLESEITRLGLSIQASQIRSWFFSTPSQPASLVPAQNRPQLPLKCPSCGAGVNPQEVEWLDNLTAACDFCGSYLRGT